MLRSLENALILTDLIILISITHMCEKLNRILFTTKKNGEEKTLKSMILKEIRLPVSLMGSTQQVLFNLESLLTTRMVTVSLAMN